MAFTKVAGTPGAPTSYIGTPGVDNIDLPTGTYFVGGRADNDIITSSNSVLTATMKAGSGVDTISANSSTLSNSFVNLNKNNDVATVGEISSSRFVGGQGDDRITINKITNSTVNGNKGSDTLTLSNAVDSNLYGGKGSDTLIIQATNTRTNVRGDDDVDTITLANNSNFANVTINGNAGNDSITVSAISSFSTSSIKGGSGNDNITGTNSAVGFTATGEIGDDTLVGGTANDNLTGGAGADTLTGGAGADTLVGGNSDDFFVYNATGQVAVGETIQGGGGTGQINGDTIQVTTADQDFTNLGTTTILTANSIENLRIDGTTTATFVGRQLTGQAISVNDNGTGNAGLAVNIQGATAVNLSTLTFTAKGAGTAFSDGNDSITLTSSADINTTVTGTTIADNFIGNNGNDTLVGGAGNDTFSGAAGIDSLNGGANDDTFTYTTAALLAADTTNGGTNTDTISMVTAANANTMTDARFDNKTNLERLALTGTGSQDVTLSTEADLAFTGGITITTDATATSFDLDGSGFDTAIVSSATGNVDTMTGGIGTDSFIAGGGADIITGNAGTDTLTGGSGADDFLFTNIVNAANAVEADVITDFNVTEVDEIEGLSIGNLDNQTIVDDLELAGNGAGAGVVADDAVVTASGTFDGLGDFDLATVAATTNVVNFSNNYTSDTQFRDAVRTGLTASGAFEANSAILATYDNGVDTFFVQITTADGVDNNAKWDDAVVTRLATLQTVTDATTLTSAANVWGAILA